eukprot:gene3341-3830_t
MAEFKEKVCQSNDIENSEMITNSIDETECADMQVQVCSSPLSHATSVSSDCENICRICLEKGTEALVAPCKCAGSAAFAHESCLLQWFFKTRRRKCELCLSEVNVKSIGFKPLQKWRVPTDSCDFVFYLFSLYCVIMFVFTGMIIWIATQGCMSPVCITLYVICSMSFVYFIYCCGCVEYSKTYWKACLTTNKNWRIYNRGESARSRIKVISVGSSDAETFKIPTRHTPVVSTTMTSSGTETMRPSYSTDAGICQSRDVSLSLAGSTTMLNTTPILQVICTQPRRSPVSPSGALSPGTSTSLIHTGSVTLFSGDDYSPLTSPCCSQKSFSSPQRYGKPKHAHIDKGTARDVASRCPEDADDASGITNAGFIDTKL